MNISFLLNQQNSISSDAGMVAQVVKQNSGQALLDLLSVGANSVISGEVVSTEGKNVVLNLGEGKLINALIDGNIEPKAGQTISFSVQRTPEKGIVLKPLFENTAALDTVNRALQNASLPLNGRLQYMVKSMMDEGLPIDKQSLYEMNHALNAIPNADASVLSQMKRLNIPLTSEMFSQFENYLNAEHEISSTISDMANSLFETLDILESSGNSSEADSILQLFTDFLTKTDEPDALNSLIDKLENISAEPEETFVTENTELESEIKNSSEEIEDNGVILQKSENGIEGKEEISSLADKAKKNLPDKTGIKISFPEESEDSVVKDGKDIKNAGRLLKSPGFREQFEKALSDRFRLTPEEVSKEDSVSRLYSKLNETVKSLMEQMEAGGKTQTPVYNALNNVNSNLEFMNQLNQTFNYVQIPLKLSGQNATGELYVYSNKKSLARSDGNVSALLHLDMDHLGPVDVHVTLNEQNNVKTRFYLKDDAALDLISENIDILNKRLEKRGYRMDSEFINKNEGSSVISEILSDTRNISVISTTSFDARA